MELEEPLLLEDQQETPLASRQCRGRGLLRPLKLKRHESTLEEYVASHPMRAEDVVYPTNMAVGDSASASCRDHNHNGFDDLLESLPPQKLSGIVTMAVFAGYACLFSMQHMIKVFFGIPDDDSSASHSFSFAITTMYISNLIFRLGQNFILFAFTPRQRALVGILAMTAAMLLLGLGIFARNSKSLATVAVAYALGGVAIGTFETNYSVVLAALGTRTKVYGISGIPLGIFLVIVPGFIAVTAGFSIVYIYCIVAGALAVGAFILIFGLTYGGDLGVIVPNTPHKCPSTGAKTQKQWVLPVLSVGAVFSLNMLFVSAFSPGVLLYLYNQPRITLIPPQQYSEYASLLENYNQVPTGYFFAAFSSLGFLSDVLSRKRIYQRKPNYHPIRFLLLTALGVTILLHQIPLLAPLATFLIFFANGSIYAQSCRILDHLLAQDDQSVLVVANSVFFFLGDCGSVIGAILIPFIRDFLSPSFL